MTVIGEKGFFRGGTLNSWSSLSSYTHQIYPALVHTFGKMEKSNNDHIYAEHVQPLNLAQSPLMQNYKSATFRDYGLPQPPSETFIFS